ncbi:MAG TPA: hypothetical protein VN719_09085 [Gemmatimonadales bacterium]|nr:hypothetical protein [Gemmatimonadales bacterium]
MSERELAFAEAMAMNPSEVEFCYEPGPCGANWSPLAAGMDQSLHGMRHAKFRRARPRVRPKRTRVQKMALALCGELEAPPVVVDAAKRYEEAVLAVCEYLRDDSKNRASYHRDVTADDIEREFLEPR